MSKETQSPKIEMVVKAINLDVLMAINYCNNGQVELGLQHLVSAQRSLGSLEVIAVKVDEVMSVIEKRMKEV